MADILEKKKGKKIVSFKFTACLGRDENGKRICKCIDGFHSASCILPQYRWENVRGFTYEEITTFQQIIQRNLLKIR